MPGSRLSRYRIVEQIGQGGMGAVYLADDTVLGRRVAVKVPRGTGDSEELRRRLLGEARAASALTHPNIAAVYDCGEADGNLFVVMEYVPGRSLAEVLARGPLEPAEAVRIAAAVLLALGAAHRHGIVHRDIKPSNIALGERGEVKVLDFGLARHIRPLALPAAATAAATLTVEAALCGTPPYMAPEQVQSGAVDPQVDLFALGAVLYECLTGLKAFAGATPMESLSKVLAHEPAPPSSIRPGVPRWLDGVVAKALVKDPAARYRSAEQMLADLERAEARPAAARLSRRRLAAAGGVAALGLATAAGWWMIREPGPYEPAPEAKRWYTEGVNAMRDGTYLKAAQALERAVRADGEFTVARALLAEAWHELDYADLARQQMLAAMPPGERPRLSHREFLQVQATARMLVRDYAGAAARYRELADRLPEAERAAALVDLGRAYEKGDKLDAALAVYHEAARRQPQFAAAFLRAGIVYRRKRVPAKAAEMLDTAESLYRSLSNAEGAVEVAYQRAILANDAGRFGEARALLEQARSAAQGEAQRIALMLQMVSICYKEGRSDEATQLAREALDLARRHRLDHLTARSLLELGTASQVAGDAAAAERYYAEGLEAARRFGGRRTEARARFSLASVRIDLGRLDAALEDIQPAFEFYQRNGYASDASRCAMVLIRARRKKGDYAGARREAEAQLEPARASRDMEQWQLVVDELGAIALDLEDYRGAMSRFAEERALARSIGHKLGQRHAAAGQAQALWRLGRQAEARLALAEAGDLGAAAKDTYVLAAVALIRAEMAGAAGHHTEAIGLAARAVKLAPQNRELEAEAARVSGTAYARSKRPGPALAATGRALELARSTGYTRLVLNALLAHSEALLAGGDAPRALEAAREAKTMAAAGGQPESEWRASLLATAAARRRGGAAPSDSDTAQPLAKLRASIAREDSAAYFARPDLRFVEGLK